MEVKVVDKSSWEKTVEVEVPTVELEEDFENAYRDYKKRIQLEGFRRGKVPIHLIKQIFGKEIQAEVAEKKVQDILTEINEERNYHLISQARLTEFSYSKDDGLKFMAELAVLPEIELTKYTGFKVEREVYQVGDEDVKAELKALQQRYATMKTVDEPAALGHVVVVDLQQLDESGVPILGRKDENLYLKIEEREGTPMSSLTAGLIGMKAGDERRIELTIPEPETGQERVDYYSVKLNEVKQQVIPELDDEFAKDLGDYESLDELKEMLRESLIEDAKLQDEEALQSLIMDEIIKANDIEVPEPMINDSLERGLEKARRESHEPVDEEEYRNHNRADVIRALKWFFARDAIIKKENISVSEEEVDARINDIVSKNINQTVQIRNYYRQQEHRNNLKYDMLNDKLFD